MMDNATVMIVEDEAVIAADLAGKIERMGHQVVGIASTAEKAIDLAISFSPQLVVVDVHLSSSKSGIQAAKVIQVLCDDAPVIFLTASAEQVDISCDNFSGPYGFISKPFKARALNSQIERMLNRNFEMASLGQDI